MPGPMTGREWLMLGTLSVVWGGAFFFNGVAVASVPVMTVVASRVSLATLVLLAVMRVNGAALPRGRGVWGALAVMAVLNNVVPFSLIVWGQGHIASGLASILNATTPLFTVLLAHGLTRDERLTPARAAGVVLGLGGVAAMAGLDALEGLGVAVAAQAACLGAAVSYALAGLYGRRFRALGVSPLATATGQVMLAALMLVPLALVVDRPSALPPPQAAAALVALAVVSTAFAYLLYFRLLASAGATNAALVIPARLTNDRLDPRV
jgi:drug/metabolite transporter (DMT)-like permease